MYTSVLQQDYSLQSVKNQEINTIDIGISGINLTEITIPQTQTDNSIYNLSLSANVMLTNSGNKVLNDCRISHHVAPFWSCLPKVS